MRISVQSDLRGRFGIGQTGEIFLRDNTQGFTNGSYGAFVREEIAADAFQDFLTNSGLQARLEITLTSVATLALLASLATGGVSTAYAASIVAPLVLQALQAGDIQRDVVKEMARAFGAPTQADRDMFDDYWEMIFDGRKFRNSEKKQIEEDLAAAYVMLADTAKAEGAFADAGESEERPLTWRRIHDEDRFDHYVIFSDIHFSALPDARARLNYAKDENLELYLRVLDFYADDAEWCLVENGDIEECVIVETTAADGQARRNLKAKMSENPVDFYSDDWQDFLRHRYDARVAALGHVFDDWSETYYAKIRERFIGEGGRYVRLTGNHDTYSNVPHEDRLLTMISAQLLGHPINDVLRIHTGGEISHVVMHGHQFDSVSLQSGKINYALSCGEVFSEATAWTNEGPDRYWDRHITAQWAHDSAPFQNQTAVEEVPSVDYGVGDALLLLAHLVLRMPPPPGLRAGLPALVAVLMDHELAWEYFESADAFQAIGLELLGGEEALKVRHLSETNLCKGYAEHMEGLESRPIVILGHTHEPRHNAVDPEEKTIRDRYMNCASAGRFHNLIWCVEITPDGDRVASWSRVGQQLRRTIWHPDTPEEADAAGRPPSLIPSAPEIFDWDPA